MASSATASVPSSAADLVELLHKSGLFKSELLAEKLAEFELPPDAAGAAAMLIRAGLLTPFQTRLLLAGKYRGFRLGTYLIRDQIGRGGMGTVYLAEHATLRRKVAVKVLAPDGASQKAGVERFLREARAAAALDHPNIVRVFDVLQSGELHYIVMEYVEGKTLDSLVQGGGAMAPGRAVTYISQAAAGLQHAYEKGFVHRDIKPANLMVAKDGTVKVLDMGLARSLVDDGDRVTEVLDEGAVVGTADFISPEQATNSPDIDIRADLYSLGATLFALVTGQPPFTGSPSQVLMQHQLKPAPSLADFDRTIAPGLAAVVAKMLAKKPAERYGTPAEVIAALAPWLPNRDGAQKVMAGLSTSELGRNSGTLQNTLDQVLSGSTRNLPKPGTPGGRRGLWIGVGSAAAALVLAVGGYLALGGSKAEAVKGPVPPAVKEVANTPAGVGTVWPTSPTRAAAKPVDRGNLYTLDLSAQQPFSDRGHTGGDWTWQSEKKDGPGGLPAGWKCFHWSQEADGEYFADADGGRMALGMRTHAGKGSAMLLAPPLKFDGPVPVTVEYRTEANSPAQLYVRFVQTGPAKLDAVNVTDLPPTNGEWKTTTFEFDPKDATEGFLEFHNHQTGADHAIRLRGLTMGAAPAARSTRPVLFRLDAGSVPEFRVGLGQNRAEGEVPAGLTIDHLGCFREGATGELVRTTLDGEPALGLASRTGTPSAQYVIGLSGDDFDPAREYLLRVVYQSRGDVGGVVLVQHIDNNYASLGEVRFAPKTAGWQTAEVRFKRPAGATVKLAFQSTKASPAPTDLAYVRSVELLDPAAVKPLFRLDPADLQTFRHRFKGQRVVSGTPGTFRAGTGLMNWKPESEAEFANEPVDGRPALAMTNLSGPVSAQFMLNLESPDNGLGLTLVPGQGYELRFEYKTVNGASGKVYTQHADYSKTGETTNLPGTGGEWRSFRYPFIRGAAPLRMLIDLDSAGPGKTFFLRTMELVAAGTTAAPVASVAPAVTERVSAKLPAPAALGKKVFGLDLAGLPTFRGKFAEGKPDGDFPTSRPGLRWFCWKKESAAEFRGEPTDRGPALGVTNLNDEVSSQLGLGLEAAAGEGGLAGGRRYVLRVEYKTSNDAAGSVQVRTADYAGVGKAELPGTGGAWRWVEVAFDRAAGQPLDAVVENTAVGEGNTLWLRAAELHEAK